MWMWFYCSTSQLCSCPVSDCHSWYANFPNTHIVLQFCLTLFKICSFLDCVAFFWDMYVTYQLVQDKKRREPGSVSNSLAQKKERVEFLQNEVKRLEQKNCTLKDRLTQRNSEKWKYPFKLMRKKRTRMDPTQAQRRLCRNLPAKWSQGSPMAMANISTGYTTQRITKQKARSNSVSHIPHCYIADSDYCCDCDTWRRLLTLRIAWKLRDCTAELKLPTCPITIIFQLPFFFFFNF
jgi:hypothetical protein